MKKTILSFLSIITILIMANWAKETSEVAGDKLHRVNFYGRIITVGNQDQEPKIDNISIDNIYKQIPVYLAPTTFTKDINPKTFVIKANPKDILTQVRVDPAEMRSITVRRVEGNPVVWKYMDGDKLRREYIEIIVISNDGSKNNYLIEANKKLHYNEISPAGPKESKLNFKGLRKLTIEGYRDRELEKKKKLDRQYRKRKGKKGLNHRYGKGIPTK